MDRIFLKVTMDSNSSYQAKNKSFWTLVVRDKAYLLMILVPFLYYIVFHYLPMYGVVIAFKDFSIGKSVFGSGWVGFKWFNQFFNSPYFFRLLRNTFLISFYSIVFGFPAPILLALFFNEMKQPIYKRFSQTVSYLPYFISVVVIVGMMFNFLNTNDGIVNILLQKMGMQPVEFMGKASWFRPLYVASDIWQKAGFGTIIYLAAISSINPELYDSADVDGCSRFRKIIHITLPGIAPTIIILFILRMGSILVVGFEKILLMYTPATYETADVIATYVYRKGVISGEFSFASAIGLFNSGVNMIFLVIFNTIARKVSDVSLW